MTELTPKQKEKYIGENYNIDFEVEVEEKAKSTSDDPLQAAAQSALKGSVGGVQGILSIQQGVSQGLTSRESALSVLQLIYGFSLEEATDLLGAPKEEVGVQLENLNHN